MGLLSSEILGGISEELTGEKEYNSSVIEFGNIIRKIIPESLEEKYVRLEHLVGIYQDIVLKMNENNSDINKESYTEEYKREELEKYIKKLNALENKIIENEKLIASIPYTDMTNLRNELINNNHNLNTQRINLQRKVTFIALRINKSLYVMNSINKDSSKLLSEVSSVIDEIKMLTNEIEKYGESNIRLDDVRIPEIRNHQLIEITEKHYSNKSIEEIKMRSMALIRFVHSYLILRKTEFSLVEKTSKEIVLSYNNREMLPENYDSFNLLEANKKLIAPLYLSNTINDIFGFGISNKNTVHDTNELCDAFNSMSVLLKSRINDTYNMEELVSTIDELKSLNPNNSTVNTLITAASDHLIKKEYDEKENKKNKEI